MSRGAAEGSPRGSSPGGDPSPLVQRILGRLMDELGGLEPGKPLPTEIELAGRFGVSRKTLRAAMRRLEREGAVQRVRGKGTFPTRGRLARALFRSRAVQIGMVSWAGCGPDGDSRDFYPQILEGAAREAMGHNCQIVLSGGDTGTEREEACYRLGDSPRIEGLIIVALTDQRLIEELAGRGKPVCLADHYSERARIDCVRVDSAGGSRLAVEHLVKLGHRRIAYIGADRPETNPARLRGYEESSEEWRLPRRPEWIVPGFGVEGGAQAAMRLMALPPADRPTAILAFSDELALGAMRALLRFGLRVPEDISVIGTGGVKSPVTVGLPALASVRFDSSQLGGTAVRFLLDRMRDPSLPPRDTLLPGRLDLGESTGPPRGNPKSRMSSPNAAEPTAR